MKKTLLCLVLTLILAASCLPPALADGGAANAGDYFTSRDLEGTWDEAKAQAVALTGSLTADAQGSDAAATAIMTTDTKKKEYALRVEIGGKAVTLGAIAKGSGMIHPNMGTML